MGRRGPPPEPTNLRLMRGDPSKKGVNHTEPKPPEAAIDAPRWLPAAARDKWQELAPKLRGMGVFTVADTDALEQYVAAYVEWRKHLAICLSGGDVITMHHPDGSVRYAQVSPSAVLVQRHGQTMQRLAREFGMTPSARSSLHTVTVDDPLGDFLKEWA
jgi:P27 family predicted phage terminase small subunit